MNKFSLNLPSSIDFGWGSTNNMPSHIKKFGKNALFFTGEKSLDESGIAANITDFLKEEGISFDAVQTEGEPSVAGIDSLVARLRNEFDLTKYDVIAAIGGGSVIDTAKAVSAMIYESGSIEDYANGTKSLSGKSMPLMAIPSTAGTGSEATYSAIIINRSDGMARKHALKHTCLMPKIAIVDPSLLITLPVEKMISCSLECMWQILEAYTSKEANIFTDSVLIEALGVLVNNIGDAYAQAVPSDVLESLSYAALLSGIGAANSSVEVTDSIAHAIGAQYGIAHSAICSSLLYAHTLINMRKAQMLEPNSTKTAKYAMAGAVFSNMEYDQSKHDVLLRAVSQQLLNIRESFMIPTLSDLGIGKDDFYKIATLTGNAVGSAYLAETDILEILELSY